MHTKDEKLNTSQAGSAYSAGLGCDYSGCDFGANYPDSCCIDGYLWDLDSCDEPGGPLSCGGDIPCPECNHEEWLEYRREEVEEKGYEAAQAFLPREPPYAFVKLRYPQDTEKLNEFWLKGYDEQKASAEA